MKTLPSHEMPVPAFGRAAYRGARRLWRGVRGCWNRLLNSIDQPLVILVYHRVADLATDPEMLAVSPNHFRKQMTFLKQHAPILRLDEEWGARTRPSVVVTFDDGYADNVQHALPILEELEVPATFFVSTGHVGTAQAFWWHRLETFLLGDGPLPPRFTLRDQRYGRTWETATGEQRRQVYARLSLFMRTLTADHREAWLEQLEAWAGDAAAPTHQHRLMSRAELRQLAASPWATLGAHTVSHPVLAALTAQQQREEILASKAVLEEICGGAITTFSYPFGRKSEYNRTSIELCREAGFTRAAANFPGQVHRWTDPMQLPRHLVRNWDVATFAGELKSFWIR